MPETHSIAIDIIGVNIPVQCTVYTVYSNRHNSLYFRDVQIPVQPPRTGQRTPTREKQGRIYV